MSSMRDILPLINGVKNKENSIDEKAELVKKDAEPAADAKPIMVVEETKDPPVLNGHDKEESADEKTSDEKDGKVATVDDTPSTNGEKATELDSAKLEPSADDQEIVASPQITLGELNGSDATAEDGKATEEAKVDASIDIVPVSPPKDEDNAPKPIHKAWCDNCKVGSAVF